MVLVSTGQGYMTVAVRGDDGNAITSTELWERLNGGFKLEHSFDLDDLCESFRVRADMRADSIVGARDVDDMIEGLKRRRETVQTLQSEFIRECSR